MAVKNGDKVSVEYEGTFDSGEIFDSTGEHGGEPLEFEVGAHQVVPGFEQAVLGKEIGVEFQIRLTPEEAYGDYNDEAVQQIPRAEFPDHITPEVGMMLQVQQQHDDHHHDIPVWIKDVDEEFVTLDFNHPMAGKTLNFKMKVVGIN